MSSRCPCRFVVAVLLALALGACLAHAQTVPSSDPNLPGLSAIDSDLMVSWLRGSADGAPIVTINTHGRGLLGNTTYLGWNDRGSWLIAGMDDAVYIWNLKSDSLTYAYDSINSVPAAELATLKDRYGAAKDTAPPTQPIPARAPGPKPETPDTSRQAAYFGGSVNVPQPATIPGAITGTGAVIANGVLTFRRADNTEASYKVIRPKVAQGAPGNTGAWIAMEDGGKGILFTMGSDNSVSGRELPAQMIQILTQSGPPR